MIDVPKAELHVHLEGTARPALARRMAERYGERIDDLIDGNSETYRWADFGEFLRAYDRVASLFRTVEDYRDLTRAYLNEIAAAGCLYVELIVSPDHPERVGLAAEDYVLGIAEGIRVHGDTHGDGAVEARLIVTGVRHLGPSAVKRAAQTAAKWRDSGPRTPTGLPLVTGFGLAGDERMDHPRDFERAFDIAHEAGLGTSCHAGEVCGAQSVRDALDHLRPDRIDHGVRAVEDDDLVTRLADTGTPLAVSIGSNVALGVFPSVREHSVAQLAEAGCRIALGSDDPPFFGNSLASEYQDADALGLDATGLTRTAIDAAFCDPATKARLTARIDAG